MTNKLAWPSNSKLGLIFGFIIALAGLICATLLIMTEHQTSGAIIGGGTLAGLVALFIYGSRGQKPPTNI